MARIQGLETSDSGPTPSNDHVLAFSANANATAKTEIGFGGGG